MRGRPRARARRPGDLEASLLDASRIEDDVQEEEPTAASQAMSAALGHDLTPSQTRFLLTGSFIDILTNISVSFIFPFLPTMLEDAGAGPYQRGLIFAALPFGVLLVSPLIPPSSLARRDQSCVGLVAHAHHGVPLPGHVRGTSTGGTKLTDQALTRCVTIWVCSRLFMGFAVAGTGVTVLCLMTRHLPRRSHVLPTASWSRRLEWDT